MPVLRHDDDGTNLTRGERIAVYVLGAALFAGTVFTIAVVFTWVFA